ncbi:HET-domain-containing protein [Acephala macrosclerotiorum]|nr:HET-domain-containing protein [Acephala macrosclerotiorum]
MRLLHTQTLKLHEFFGTEIPPYAILSHTWDEGEVSFQEWQSGNGKSKAGYDKVRRCCQMAALDGFPYAWVDTCCIDKTSSSELSEAINSMYSWYRLSEVCYVYLADVPGRLGLKATKKAVRESRWFTRGWTLQELIAPPNVIFFNNKWTEVGTKETLETLIFDITKIHGEVLRDADKMEEFSIAQKMCWASKRVTTRIEDIAYCLLGIFGVHMPMLYGEGDHAFIRLQEEIMRNTADHSIFAWANESYFKGQLPGLLALTPAHFADSGDIVQSESVAISPFSVTNKGIHLNLRTKLFNKSSVCLAILECHKIGDDRNLGIYIERQPKSSGVFKRVWGERLGNVNQTSLSPNFQLEDIFVKQERVLTPPPLYERYGILWPRTGFVLKDSMPASLQFVTSNTRRLPSSYSSARKFSAFHFLEENASYGFVVVVKHTKNPANDKTLLRLKVLGEIPLDLDLGQEREGLVVDQRLQNLCSQLEENPTYEQSLMSDSGERLYWQHPVRKWWIIVTIRRGMAFEYERMKLVHIKWYTPVKD